MLLLSKASGATLGELHDPDPNPNPDPNPDPDLKLNQAGRTGFPLVDAAMTQLWRTGWIPNYMRHVVAGFLVWRPSPSTQRRPLTPALT